MIQERGLISSSANDYGYWMDKNFHQLFDYIGKLDLVFNILWGGSNAVLMTPALTAQYESSGSISISVTTRSPSSSYTAKLSGSEYATTPQGSYMLSYLPIETTTVYSTLTQYGLKFRDTADAEGMYLNFVFGIVTLSCDARLIKAISRVPGNVPCFWPTDILAANVLRGTLSCRDAQEFCVRWGEKDLRWLPKQWNSFDSYYASVDKDLLRRYFRV